MSRILYAMRPTRWALLATVLAGLLLPGTVSAGESSSEIEGVWSFNGGAVDVVAIPGGKFEGIVTAQTQFASCPHTVGEKMWTNITPQGESGYYWGLHQWFHADCSKNSQLGPTAWRVIHEPNGKRLRVCFSDPGGPQPTIAANGAPNADSEYAAHHVSFGCVTSALIEPLPVASGTNSGPAAKGEVEAISLRKANQCVRPGLFKLSFKQPKYDPFKKVTVTFQGHRVRLSHKGANIVVTLNLRHLKKKTFTVKVTAITVLGHRLRTKRTYHLCAPKKPKHHTKKHHKKG